MRKFRFLFLILSLSILSLSSCKNDDEEDEPILQEEPSQRVEQYSTIDFENVSLTDSVFKTATFISGSMSFDNNYNATYASWSGFACSSKKDKQTAGFTNDLSVFANAAASGSKFGVYYYSSYDANAYCKFVNNDSYIIKEIKICNNTYAYLSMKNGDAYAKQFTTNDWFKVTIIGYNNTGVKTDSVDFYLADFRNTKTYICDNWTSVNLEKLGNVNKIGFKFSSTDNGLYGMNTPSYFCIDDIKYILPKLN